MDVLSDAITAMRTGRPHSARRELRPPWRLRAQPFAGAGFHIVLQGAGWLLPPDGPPTALSAGDLVFLPHGCAHGLADAPFASLDGVPPMALADDDEESTPVAGGAGAPTVLLCGAYFMDRSRLHPLLGEVPEVVHIPARVGTHPSLRAAIDLLGAELRQVRPGADAVLPSLLDLLLLYILRAWYDEQSDHHAATGWAAALSDPAISAALRAIHREPARPWTVRSLGAEAGISRAPFARRFAALIGRPPLSYLTWWRMVTAARLLRDSDAPLYAVAQRTGYTSEFAFAKAFKREHGIAPGVYRRQHS